MKTIDISNKLNNESVMVKVAEGIEFKAFTGFKISLGVKALFKNEDLTEENAFEKMLQAIAMVLGKEARQYCEEHEETMTVDEVQYVYFSAIAAVQNIEVEEVAARFQRATKKDTAE